MPGHFATAMQVLTYLTAILKHHLYPNVALSQARLALDILHTEGDFVTGFLRDRTGHPADTYFII